MGDIDHDDRAWTLRARRAGNGMVVREVVEGESVEVVPASRLEGAVDALMRYGQHQTDCALYGVSAAGVIVECDCGLEAARRAVGGRDA